MYNIYHILGQEELTPDEQRAEEQSFRSVRTAQIASAASFHVPPPPDIPNAVFLRPQDAEYADYLPLHNKRNDIAPALRIVCTAKQAVSDAIKWIADNDLPLALRCGGHCFEGFSQSSGVVIDLRRMDSTTVHSARNTVTIEAGASLGKVYREVAAEGFAFAAGSCPTVGITGHALGGGMGLLGRRYGLACDNLKEVELVDSNGEIRTADVNTNQDHFWAARGGGGGSFAVATRFVFDVHRLTHVHTFGVTWEFSNTPTTLSMARDVFDAWQRWAPEAPRSITAIMKVQHAPGGRLHLRCIGQTTGSEAELRGELSANLIVHRPTHALTISRKTFMEAVEGFGGRFDYQSVLMEGKSDVVEQPLTGSAIETLFDAILAIPVGHIVAICDPYGGAIADVSQGATAFPHRGAKTWVVQYYSEWKRASQTGSRLSEQEQVYRAMRPTMSGKAYVNYPDIGLPDYADAYWSDNLPRLRQIKTALDPENFFRHGQSIPPQ